MSNSPENPRYESPSHRNSFPSLPPPAPPSAASIPPSINQIITQDYHQLVSYFQQHTKSSTQSMLPSLLPPPLPPSHLTLDADENLQSLDKLNSLEQLLLQHLHTAGIKKSKEQTLIDEFLNMKQLRKQLITRYTSYIQQVTDYHQHILHYYHENIQKFLNYQEIVERNHQQELNTMSCQYFDRLKIEKKELTKKYSKYLQELEKKIQLIEEKNHEKDDGGEETEEMRQRIQRLQQQLEEMELKNQKLHQKYVYILSI